MHSLATVLGQIWGQFRGNLVRYGSKCPIMNGVHQSVTAGGPSNGQIYKRPLDTGRNHSGSIPIWSGDLQLQGLTLCGSVTAGRHNSIFLKLYNIFDLHRSPVDRQPLTIWTLCFLCLPCLPLPSNAVNRKAWTCTAKPQYSVKFGNNSVEIWYFTGQNVLFWRGKMSYSEGGPSNGQIYKLPLDTRLNHSGWIPIWSGDLQL